MPPPMTATFGGLPSLFFAQADITRAAITTKITMAENIKCIAFPSKPTPWNLKWMRQFPAVQCTYISSSLLSVVGNSDRFIGKRLHRHSLFADKNTIPSFKSISSRLHLRLHGPVQPIGLRCWDFINHRVHLQEILKCQAQIHASSKSTWKQRDWICLSQLSSTCRLSKCTTESIWFVMHERIWRTIHIWEGTWSMWPCILPSVIILLAMRSALFWGISNRRPVARQDMRTKSVTSVPT